MACTRGDCENGLASPAGNLPCRGARPRFRAAANLMVNLAGGCVLFFLTGNLTVAQPPATTTALQDDWPYERELHFSAATPRKNCVIAVTLAAETLGNPYQHFNGDGSDLRFTTSDGTIPLNHWIESWDPAGRSRVWVKIPAAGTAAIRMKYGNRAAASASAGAGVFDFFDDFNDGVWTKHDRNPVMTRTEPWEARAVCEPSVIFEDGRFQMWYMGCATSVGKNAALGHATSPDGITWTKAGNDPILRDPEQAIIRPTVLKHQGTYYLFACDYQWDESATGNLFRWTSADGQNWSNKTVVLEPTLPWEKKLENVGIVIDESGTWQMLYTTEQGFGAARSPDGLHWTKLSERPLAMGGYGGDPYLTKIAGTYYTWHSQAQHDHLLIYCRKSTDLVHWEVVGTGPALNYTQPWERGIGRSEVYWDRHLADADLVEADGTVWLHYGGAQCPFGVATFPGTLAQLAQRLESNPPLQQWAASHYGCVENNQLKVSDNGTRDRPLHETAARFNDRNGYTVQCRVQAYAGYRVEPAQTSPEGWASSTRSVAADQPQVAVVMRYRDDDNMACFRLVDSDTTSYEEKIGGRWSAPISIGANQAGDNHWHSWRIDVQGDKNSLFIDGRLIGCQTSSPALCDRSDLQVGVATSDAFAAFDDLRVTEFGVADVAVTIGNESRAGEKAAR